MMAATKKIEVETMIPFDSSAMNKRKLKKSTLNKLTQLRNGHNHGRDAFIFFQLLMRTFV